MNAVLKIWNETQGQGRRKSAELTLASERITTAELIRGRVEAEVAVFNSRVGEVFQGLVQPTESDGFPYGRHLRKPRKLDAEEQVGTALEAFRNNGVILPSDSRQIDEPDELLTITPASEATFLKPAPLVGR